MKFLVLLFSFSLTLMAAEPATEQVPEPLGMGDELTAVEPILEAPAGKITLKMPSVDELRRLLEEEEQRLGELENYPEAPGQNPTN